MRSHLVHNLGYDRTMKQVNMHDANTHLSRYVAELKPGDTLVLCNRNEPVAEIRALAPKKKVKRRIGWAKGEFTVPDSFFEPLPEDILRAFNGE
jgi:antitoxin (DNA-binding transcriptional repressor) of toxin-antitoxin stability system